ncbi:MAG: type IX secretion system membrane protein PorP/SprF [Opitutaceae bacterium]|nr:type IX secretion system membrane protein PorP/SprF [Cytophagales bacterium]
MKIRYFLTLILLVCLCENITLAQINLYPAHYSMIIDVNRLYNPALVNPNGYASLELGNQFYTGAYNKVENHYFLACINVSKQDSNHIKNNIGLKILNEKEGEFINKPKAYFSYALHVQLTELYHISAGIDLGLASYIYKATNISAGGSSTVPDGNIGISFYSQHFKVGLASNQFLNTVLLPKTVSFRWKRIYTFYIEKNFRLGESNLLSLYVQKQFLPYLKDGNDVGISLIIGNIFQLGLSETFGQRHSFFAGFKSIPYERNSFNLTFCYSVPQTNASQANNPSYEIMLGYWPGRKHHN